jgi:hypothetical protein
MLPMGILLSVVTFKSLLTSIHGSSNKTPWAVYVLICHLIFILFLCGHRDVLWGAWAAVVISLVYFSVYFYGGNKISYLLGFCMILLAVFVQSAQVYGFLDKKIFKYQQDALNYKPLTQTANIPHEEKLDLYYASNWFSLLNNYISSQVFRDYKRRQFIFYDNVVPVGDNPEVFRSLQTAMAENDNIAFIPTSDAKPGDWRSNHNADPQADIDPVSSGELSVLPSDVNTWKLRTRLANSRFLVINDNYNSDWHAFINGHPARLFRANISFKGLWVPPGESSIVLRFSNPKRYMFHIGMIALFAAVFLYLLVLLRTNKQPESYV